MYNKNVIIVSVVIAIVVSFMLGNGFIESKARMIV